MSLSSNQFFHKGLTYHIVYSYAHIHFSFIENEFFFL